MVRINYRKLAHHRVISSTLLEVTVALIIISMIFSLATVIYINVQKTVLSTVKLSAELLISDVYAETCKTKTFTDKEIATKDMVVYQTVRKHASAPGLLEITVEARYNNGKLLSEQKHMIYAPE